MRRMAPPRLRPPGRPSSGTWPSARSARAGPLRNERSKVRYRRPPRHPNHGVRGGHHPSPRRARGERLPRKNGRRGHHRRPRKSKVSVVAGRAGSGGVAASGISPTGERRRTSWRRPPRTWRTRRRTGRVGWASGTFRSISAGPWAFSRTHRPMVDHEGGNTYFLESKWLVYWQPGRLGAHRIRGELASTPPGCRRRSGLRAGRRAWAQPPPLQDSGHASGLRPPAQDRTGGWAGCREVQTPVVVALRGVQEMRAARPPGGTSRPRGPDHRPTMGPQH